MPMPDRRSHDRRPAVEILAQERFAPYRVLPGLEELSLRELRTFDRFIVFAKGQGVEAPSVEDFLAFVAMDRSPRQLENLRLVFARVLPANAAVHGTLRAAIRQKRPRGRTCDRRPRDVIVACAHFEDYRDLPALQDIPLEELRVLDRFLIFAGERGLEIPTTGDFLAFSADTSSPRRLRSLYSALDKLLPGNPAVRLTLIEAIRRKTPEAGAPRRPGTPRAAQCSVPRDALPEDWQTSLEAMRAGEILSGLPALAATTMKSLEEALRQYAHSLRSAGLPVEISLDGIRVHEAAMIDGVILDRNGNKLRDRGSRPATLHTATMRLRQFGERHGIAADLVADLRVHENVLRRRVGAVNALKFGKFHDLPGLRDTWMLALALLEESRKSGRRATGLRLRNEALVIALWSLVPLRLQDGVLLWGEQLTRPEGRYQIGLVTNKTDEPLEGPLHDRLKPFLDALVLEGVDAGYLDIMRDRAIAERLPLLRRLDGGPLDSRYPSTVWLKHMGTGAHIARTRVHTELARFGPQGVEAALALCAQTDTRTKAFYRGKAARDAEVRRGQDLVELLCDELDSEDPGAE